MWACEIMWASIHDHVGNLCVFLWKATDGKMRWSSSSPPPWQGLLWNHWYNVALPFWWNSGDRVRIKGDGLPFFLKPAFWRLSMLVPASLAILGLDLPFFIYLIDRVTYVLLLWGFHFPAAQLLGFSGFLITWWVSVQPSLPAKLVEGPRSHLKLCAAEFDWKDWDLQFCEVIPKDGTCHASSSWRLEFPRSMVARCLCAASKDAGSRLEASKRMWLAVDVLVGWLFTSRLILQIPGPMPSVTRRP